MTRKMTLHSPLISEMTNGAQNEFRESLRGNDELTEAFRLPPRPKKPPKVVKRPRTQFGPLVLLTAISALTLLGVLYTIYQIYVAIHTPHPEEYQQPAPPYEPAN